MRRHGVRGRLQHRLFLWFGLSILITGMTVGAVMHLLGGSASWRRDVERVRRFVGGQFAAVWRRPAERDALAAAMARDLEVHVTLRDAGRPLAAFGPPCHGPRWRVPVTPEGGLEICGARFGLDPLRMGVALLLACVALWLASGAIARRLARPHVQLARVAQDLGAGRLSSRANLDCREHGEVGLLADAINEMAARIERQLADQRELLAVVSHELRTPLQRIRVLVELLRDAGGEARHLDQLEREVLEIDGLVGELLAGARLDFTALAARPLDAAQLAREALERSGHGAVLLLVEADSTSFSGDPTLVARALANLIDNADRHGAGLQRLRVRSGVGPDDGHLAFEAEDGGAGLPAGAEQHMFEPFRRFGDDAPPPGPRPGSLGLGLALVKRIAEAHGGRAYARNRPEGGALVGFTAAR